MTHTPAESSSPEPCSFQVEVFDVILGAELAAQQRSICAVHVVPGISGGEVPGAAESDELVWEDLVEAAIHQAAIVLVFVGVEARRVEGEPGQRSRPPDSAQQYLRHKGRRSRGPYTRREMQRQAALLKCP